MKLSADGIPFLLHDDTLERTTTGRGAAADLPYAAVAQLDAGIRFDRAYAGERVPTLVEALERCAAHGIVANVEIKPSPGEDDETGARVAQIVREFHANGVAPLLSSFSTEALAAAKRTAPGLPRGLLVGALPLDWRARAAQLGCFSLHLDVRQLREETVTDVHAAELSVFVYTVNEPDRAAELLSVGVDAVCTDRLDAIAMR